MGLISAPVIPISNNPKDIALAFMDVSKKINSIPSNSSNNVANITSTNVSVGSNSNVSVSVSSGMLVIGGNATTNINVLLPKPTSGFSVYYVAIQAYGSVQYTITFTSNTNSRTATFNIPVGSGISATYPVYTLLVDTAGNVLTPSAVYT